MSNGKLYIVATPIGNLGDISRRALETLKAVDRILAEDTRQTLKLLNNFNIKNKVDAFHEHNEEKLLDSVVQDIENGQEIALVSDAGLPLISDPGYKLVRELTSLELTVEVIPGPSAATTALLLSGLPTDKFAFYGFPPPKKGKRLNFFEELKNLYKDHPITLIFFESPYRIVYTLENISDIFGPDTPVSVSREMTKLHEETLQGTATEVLESLRAKKPKGEYTVCLRTN